MLVAEGHIATEMRRSSTVAAGYPATSSPESGR